MANFISIGQKSVPIYEYMSPPVLAERKNDECVATAEVGAVW